MRLLGRNRLRGLYGMDSRTDLWLRGWEAELSHANWKAAIDLRRQFPRAREVAEDIFDFPSPYNQKAIRVAVTFPLAVALVLGLECST